MLEIEDLHISYDDAPAVWEVTLSIREGQLISVLGPNGAGKTTLIKAIARLLPVRKGSIRFEGQDITSMSARDVGALGLALIPEGRRLFTSMTVEENLEIGCYRRQSRQHRAQSLDQVYSIFPILSERRRQIAGTMSGGQQQMVAIGRALMARPKLLLIDEPSLGLAPIVVGQVFDTLKLIHQAGVSMLLIEQNAVKALDIAQYAYVLEGGRVVAEGQAETMLAEPRIRRAYLGLDSSDAS
jgi:branched-chain amino acid transport system ATP-binding protein